MMKKEQWDKAFLRELAITALRVAAPCPSYWRSIIVAAEASDLQFRDSNYQDRFIYLVGLGCVGCHLSEPVKAKFWLERGIPQHHVYNTSHQGRKQHRKECATCLQACKEEEITASLNCGHMFHFFCAASKLR